MNILSSPRKRLSDPTLETRPTALEEHATLFEQVGVFVGVFFPFVALVYAIIHYWGHGVDRVDVVLLLVFYAITVIGITVGYHRLLTHRSFETHPAVKFLLVAAGSMSLQGPALQWCAVHRRHHQQSDRPGDPHSPHVHEHGFWGILKGMWHSHVGWLFVPTAPDLYRSVNDLLEDKAVIAAERLFWVWVVLGVAIPTAVAGWVTHSWAGAAGGFLWGGLIRMCLMHHATWCINSVCHLWGTRPYASSDHSRNNPIFGVVSFGEGWHNNHHAFPTSARHGLKWWQFDISWLFIQFLKVTGLAWNVRVPSEAAKAAKMRKSEPSPSAGQSQLEAMAANNA